MCCRSTMTRQGRAWLLHAVPARCLVLQAMQQDGWVRRPGRLAGGRQLVCCVRSAQARAASLDAPPSPGPPTRPPQYFETMSGARRDGRTQQQYYDFSLNSARAAQVGQGRAAGQAPSGPAPRLFYSCRHRCRSVAILVQSHTQRARLKGVGVTSSMVFGSIGMRIAAKASTLCPAVVPKRCAPPFRPSCESSWRSCQRTSGRRPQRSWPACRFEPRASLQPGSWCGPGAAASL